MIKIAITGSLASGKTTASKFISNKRGPLFSADYAVKELYAKLSFKRFIAKKLNFPFNSQFKNILKKVILERKENLKKLEKIIHPLVRKTMITFLKRNKKEKFLFFEIPLLIENKLTKHFDITIFIKSNKNLRLKRYKSKIKNDKLFYLLDQQQMKDTKKMRFCDHIVVNNDSLAILKKNLLNIIKSYE